MRPRAEIEQTAKTNYNAATIELLADIRELLQYLVDELNNAKIREIERQADGGAI